MNIDRSYYHTLVRRVDDFSAGVTARIRELDGLFPGCGLVLHSRNRQRDRIVIASQTPASLEPMRMKALSHRAAEPFHEGQACVLLENGLCVLYVARPLICRTHGLPVFVDGAVVFLPENFTGLSGLNRRLSRT